RLPISRLCAWVSSTALSSPSPAIAKMASGTWRMASSRYVYDLFANRDERLSEQLVGPFPGSARSLELASMAHRTRRKGYGYESRGLCEVGRERFGTAAGRLPSRQRYTDPGSSQTAAVVD